MDFESEYRRYKQLYRELKRQIGGGVDTKSLKKLLRKHRQRLDEKGRSFIFFKGKPIIADQKGSVAHGKMIDRIARQPAKFDGQTLVQINIRTFPKSVNDEVRGGIHVIISVFSIWLEDGKPRISTRDTTHSVIRICYNRDELADFKLSELKKFAIAAEKMKYKDTGIGHYQYTEAKELW